jgi:hypothetical protein
LHKIDEGVDYCLDKIVLTLEYKVENETSLKTDSDLFKIIFPAIVSLMDYKDCPVKVVREALHHWTRPPSDQAIPWLSDDQFNTIIAWLRKRAGDDYLLDEAKIYSATVDILERGKNFHPFRTW